METKKRKNLLAKEIIRKKPMECHYVGQEYLEIGLNHQEYENIAEKAEIMQYYISMAKTPIWMYSLRYLTALILIGIVSGVGVAMLRFKYSIQEIFDKLPALMYCLFIFLVLFLGFCIYPFLRFKIILRNHTVLQAYDEYYREMEKYRLEREDAVSIILLNYRLDKIKRKKIYHYEVRQVYFDEENLFLRGDFDCYRVPLNKILFKNIKINCIKLPYSLFHQKPQFFNPGMKYLFPVFCNLYTIEIEGTEQNYYIQCFSENLSLLILTLEVYFGQSLPKIKNTSSIKG